MNKTIFQHHRDTAYSWHSGMWSPLYAFASSGIIANRNALIDEIDKDIDWMCDQELNQKRDLEDPRDQDGHQYQIKHDDLSDLIALREFVLGLPTTKDGKARAPWAQP